MSPATRRAKLLAMDVLESWDGAPDSISNDAYISQLCTNLGYPCNVEQLAREFVDEVVEYRSNPWNDDESDDMVIDRYIAEQVAEGNLPAEDGQLGAAA